MTFLSLVASVIATVVMVVLVVMLGFRFDRVNVGLLILGAVAIVVVFAVMPLH